MKQIIAPSILAADFSNLSTEMEMINHSSAEWVHIDVMDGAFVPNITFGAKVIKTIRGLTDKILDVHMMVEKPERYFDDFKKAGADIITVHLEASPNLHRSLQNIKDIGLKAGVAINPHSNVTLLEDVLNIADLILIMSVNPGFGGQSFIERTYEKLSTLNKMINEQGVDPYVEVDGGVGLDNAAKLLEAGANVLVSGSAVFKAEDPVGYIDKLAKL
ncbi:MAG TPA: ribulose-phosphate 3-epimerase [Bacteroidetes bacterium]|nr:ribulose-phosphate 3-epimerase [Bacteroidota bacterium]